MSSLAGGFSCTTTKLPAAVAVVAGAAVEGLGVRPHLVAL